MSKIRVICFDLDDTLWAIDPVIRHAEATLQHWLKAHYPKLAKFDPLHMQELRKTAAQRYPHLAHDLGALRKASMAEAATSVGYEASMVEQAFAIFLKARHEVDLYPDVLPVLEKLAQHYTLCALTNGNANVQLVGLGHVFTEAITAKEIGKAKPDPAAFAVVSERLKIDPTEVVHIGDDAICDVQGALNAGMKAVWMNRDKGKWHSDLQPDAIIETLWELEGVLAGWING